MSRRRTPAAVTLTEGEPRWLDDEQQAAWRSWLAGSAALAEALNRDLDVHGVTLSEYEILVRLSEAEDGAMRMNELATAVVHSRSRLTHTVARMERRELVTRTACPEDRRGVVCALTPQGRDFLVQVAPHHVESVRQRLVDVLTREELLTLGAAMERVAERLGGCPPDPR